MTDKTDSMDEILETTNDKLNKLFESLEKLGRSYNYERLVYDVSHQIRFILYKQHQAIVKLDHEVNKLRC